MVSRGRHQKTSTSDKDSKSYWIRRALSKRMAQVKTGSDYSDVSNAIDSLRANERNMIRISSPAILGRKDKRYYALTGKGLKAFIDENTLPSSSSEDFWKAVLWYMLTQS